MSRSRSHGGPVRKWGPPKCPRCGSEVIGYGLTLQCTKCCFETSQWFFRLPRDIPVLADTLGLSLDEVNQLLSDGIIPIRRIRGNPRGRRVVVLYDNEGALKLRNPVSFT